MESLSYNKSSITYTHYLDQGVKWPVAELISLSKLLRHAYILTKNKDWISKRHWKASNLMVGDLSLVYKLSTMDWENQTRIILSNPKKMQVRVTCHKIKVNKNKPNS